MKHDMTDEDLEDEWLEEEEDEREHKASGVASWGISLMVHAAVLLILTVIIFAQTLDEDPPPIRAAQIQPPEEKVEEEKETREIETTEITIEAEEVVENPVPVELELVVDEIETEEEEVSEVSAAKGREEAVSASEMGGAGAFMAIGGGGGASGAFGNRSGGGKRRALGRYGGNQASENAVLAALRWFARHQSPNGMWDVDGYPANCPDNPKCEPGEKHTDIGADVAMTGYAVLAFLGAGYDHVTPNKFRKTVKSGVDYLLSQVDETGKFPGVNYTQGIAAMALAEAYGMSNDPKLRDKTQKAINEILRQQNKDPEDPVPESGLSSSGGLGWNYTGPADKNDGSVSGWCVMALKSAKACGLNVGNGLAGSKNYLIKAWRDANPNWKTLDAYSDRSVFPYKWYGGVKGSADKLQLACVGALCSVFLGYKEGDVMLSTLINEIMATQVPEKYPCNTYYMYYNTLGVFMAGGNKWKTWNEKVRPMLINAQRKEDGCFNGSWNYQFTKFHGHNTGRLLSTAYCCLSLEVYYRYVPIGK